jgi:hypothetical protein
LKGKKEKKKNKTHLIWIEFIIPYSVFDLILGSKNLCGGGGGGGEQQHLVAKGGFVFHVKILNF